jgi:hypothetical protein
MYVWNSLRNLANNSYGRQKEGKELFPANNSSDSKNDPFQDLNQWER